MATDESPVKAVRVLFFSGKKSDYWMWKEQWLGTLSITERNVAEGRIQVPKSTEALDPATDAAKIAAREANRLAFSKLQLSQKTKAAFGIICGAKTDDLPDGCVKTALEKMDKRYKPTTFSDQMTMEEQFDNCKMKDKTGHPQKWFSRLERLMADLKHNFNVDISEGKYVKHVLKYLPAAYNDVTRKMLKVLNEGKQVTKEDLESEIMVEYGIQKKQRNWHDDDPSDDEEEDAEEGDQALAAAGGGRKFKKPFKGMCALCGKKGHKRDDCWKLEKNKDKRPKNWKGDSSKKEDKGKKLFCSYCKKTGHTIDKCFKLKAKKERQEEAENNKDGNETAEIMLSLVSKEDVQVEDEVIEPLPDDFFDNFEASDSEEMVSDIMDEANLSAFGEETQEPEDVLEGFDPVNLQNTLEDDDEDSLGSHNSGLSYVLNSSQWSHADVIEETQATKKRTAEAQARARDNQDLSSFVERLNLYESFSTTSQELNQSSLISGPETVNEDDSDDEESVPESLPELGTYEDLSVSDSESEEEDLDSEEEYEDPEEESEDDSTHTSMPSLVERTGFDFESLDDDSTVEGYALMDNISGTQSEDSAESIPEFVMIDKEYTFDKVTPNTVFCDSAASSDMRNSTEGMINLKPYKKKIKVGNSETMTSTYIGEFHGDILTKQNTLIPYHRKNVIVIPQLWTNLHSLAKDLKDETCKIENKHKTIQLTLHGKKVLFDRNYSAGQGHLIGIEVLPRKFEDEEAGNVSKQMKVAIDTMHQMLGHPDEATARATAKALGYEIKRGKMKKCPSCAIGKAKQKNVSKTNPKKATDKGGRLFMDISSVKSASYGGAKFWVLIEDDATEMCWSLFLKKKSELKHQAIPFIKKLKKRTGVDIKIIRCDNAGENKELQKAIDQDSELNIDFEYTAPYTPQQNKVERKFATFHGRVRAVLNGAELPSRIRTKLWAEAANHATQVDSILVKPGETESAYKKFYGDDPEWAKGHLRTFGEMAVVAIQHNKKVRAKLADRGTVCMMVGYPEDHAPDVYRFLKLNTEKPIMSRNVTWLGQTYAEFKKIPVHVQRATEDGEEDDSSDDETTDPNTQEQEGTDQGSSHESSNDSDTDSQEEEGTEDPNPTQATQIPTRLLTELRRLDTSYNPTMEHISTAKVKKKTADNKKVTWKETLEEYGPIAMVGFMPADTKDPPNVKAAKQTKEWQHWWKGCVKEFDDMESKPVWEIKLKSEVPEGRRLVGCKWVFKLKDNGVYRSRLCAQGFTQKPGVDFQENFAPVVHDVTFRVSLVTKLAFGLEDEQFDVETAFLYGDLDEEIYMELPELYDKYLAEKGKKGYSHDTHCVLLKKSIYGLVQAARQWWKKFKEKLDKLGYKPSAADPCLFVKQDSEKISLIFVYVDDGGILGTKAVIQDTMEKLSSSLSIKRMGSIESFVGCVLTTDMKNKTIWVTQPKLIGHLKEKFAEEVPNKEVKIPAGPGFRVLKPRDTDPLISEDQQARYRTGVGMLLYLVKLSRPDISNAVRELTKVLSGATETHYKAMLRCIKYIFETEYKGLKIKPICGDGSLFKLRGLCDSDFAGDQDTRISVYGFILYLCGAPISWRSKSGRSVTLSSTEAEYVAISELAKEVIFVKQLLESIGIELEYPIIIEVDNVGAIYLAYNPSLSQRTKHMDCRMHYVREFCEDGILKVIFVSSEDNDSDICTKNTMQKTFEKHSDKVLEEVPKDLMK